MRRVTSILQWIEVNNAWLIILLLSMVMGGLLGISLGYAIKNLKHPPIQIISINEEALIKEKSLKLGKLNLDEVELKRELLNFKQALTGFLSALPPHFIVVRSHVLLRTDNVLDLTQEFRALLAKQPEEKKP